MSASQDADAKCQLAISTVAHDGVAGRVDESAQIGLDQGTIFFPDEPAK